MHFYSLSLGSNGRLSKLISFDIPWGCRPGIKLVFRLMRDLKSFSSGGLLICIIRIHVAQRSLLWGVFFIRRHILGHLLVNLNLLLILEILCRNTRYIKLIWLYRLRYLLNCFIWGFKLCSIFVTVIFNILAFILNNNSFLFLLGWRRSSFSCWLFGNFFRRSFWINCFFGLHLLGLLLLPLFAAGCLDTFLWLFCNLHVNNLVAICRRLSPMSHCGVWIRICYSNAWLPVASGLLIDTVLGDRLLWWRLHCHVVAFRENWCTVCGHSIHYAILAEIYSVYSFALWDNSVDDRPRNLLMVGHGL